MNSEKAPIIDIEQLNQKLKKQNLIPIQIEHIKTNNRVILEKDLTDFLELIKTYEQNHVYFKYDFYKKSDYEIPKDYYDLQEEEFINEINTHNEKIKSFDFNIPKSLEIFIIKDGFLVGINQENFWIEEKNIKSADLAIHEVDLNFSVQPKSKTNEDKNELREIIFNDPEFASKTNQESRYYYLVNLLEEQELYNKYKHLFSPPGYFKSGKMKMFMDETAKIFKETKNKKE